MNIVCYGVSITAQKEQAGYFHAFKKLLSELPNTNLEHISFAARVLVQAGLAFMREIELLKIKPNICIIVRMTPAAKFKALSRYLLELDCLLCRVNFPRADDLNNKRECYIQVKKHFSDDNFPYIVILQDWQFLSESTEVFIRDKVQKKPAGAKVCAEIPRENIVKIDVKHYLNTPRADIFNEAPVAPSLNEVDLLLKPSVNSINLKLKLTNKKKFELYSLSTIGADTPILSISLNNIITGFSEVIIINCLDARSHYNREKCVQVPLECLDADEYAMSLYAVDKVAISDIQVKKLGNLEIYQDGQPLKLPIKTILSGVKLESFLMEKNNV
jgi:hypothetical protein